MQIFVKTLKDKIIVLDVKGSDTFDSVKAQIQAREGIILPGCQRLSYAGRPLRDGLTLDNYKVRKEFTSYLALGLCGGTMVKVKTLTGKEIEIDIEPDDTVARIKERVEEREGIPPLQQRLIYSDNQAFAPPLLLSPL